MENLLLKINENEFKAEFDKRNNANLSINGKPYIIEMLKKYNSNIFSFSANQKLAQVEFELNEKGNLTVNYEGMFYEVEVYNETTKMLEKYLKQAGNGLAAGMTIVKAPMPGMVVKILVKEGIAVNKGDNMVIIEAMKMENALKAATTGTVKKILVREGQAVEKDAPLVEFDTGVPV